MPNMVMSFQIYSKKFQLIITKHNGHWDHHQDKQKVSTNSFGQKIRFRGK